MTLEVIVAVMVQAPLTVPDLAGTVPVPEIVNALPEAFNVTPLQVVAGAGVAAKVNPAGRLNGVAAVNVTGFVVSLPSESVSVLFVPLMNEAGATSTTAVEASACEAKPNVPRAARPRETRRRLGESLEL